MFEMIRIEIDRASFEKGEEDGREGRKYRVPPGVDSFSYCSGFVEGRAVRNGNEGSPFGTDCVHDEGERGGR